MEAFIVTVAFYVLVGGGATLILSLLYGKKTPKPEVKR